MTVGKPKRKPSMYDVAAIAGVSHQTVSRVLNNHPSIRESTREKVLRAIDEVHYTPNSIARALATNRSHRIGALVDTPVHYGPNSTLRRQAHQGGERPELLPAGAEALPAAVLRWFLGSRP